MLILIFKPPPQRQLDTDALVVVAAATSSRRREIAAQAELVRASAFPLRWAATTRFSGQPGAPVTNLNALSPP